MSKRLIIGLGSGRTGSKSLAFLFNEQPYCIGTHEGIHLPWDVDMDGLDRAMQFLDRQEAPLIVDSACYWLNYVPLIKQRLPETKFICLYRDKEEIAGSFLRKTWGYNSWTRRDSHHHADRYNKRMYLFFPHYDVPKKEAIRKYIDAYYALAECYVNKDFKIFDTYNLNTIDGMRSILNFVGIPEEQQVIKVFHENINAVNR